MTLPVTGSKCLLRISDGSSSPAFLLVEGLRLTSWKIEQEEVDVTVATDEGWRRLLFGAGLRSLEVQISGLYLRSAGELLLRQAALSGAIFKGELTLDEGEVIAGPFVTSDLRFDNMVNEEVTYAATLRSAGPMTVG
jgi:predicted secreted protein